MFRQIVLPLLLVVANITGAGMVIPQVARLHRFRRAEGVSAPWVGVSFALNVTWVAYGIAEQLWGLVPVSVVGALLYGVIGLQLTAISGKTTAESMARWSIVTTAWPIAGYALGGWTAVGLAAGLAYGAQFVPAATAAIQVVNPVGVSLTTWVLAWIEAAVWVIYGLAQTDLALIVGGGGGALVSSVILLHLGATTAKSVDTPYRRSARLVR